MSSDGFDHDLDEGRRLLALRGELDEPIIVELRQAISEATAELTSDLAIDLAEVTFMPSAAIGVLATSQSEARSNGATITLVAPPGTVAARLLTICALDHVPSLG